MSASLEKALAQHLAGRLADAEVSYREVLKEEPEQARALFGLGTVLLQTSRAAEAFEYLKSATTLSPADADALNNLATAAVQIGHLDVAREAYERVLEIAPDHLQAQANQGVVLYKLGNLEASADAFERAVRAERVPADTWLNYSQTLRAQGRHAEAESSARKALDLTPRNRDAQLNLANTLSAKGDASGAEAIYRQTLHSDPKAAEAHHNLAMILLQQGRLQEGWDAFEWRWQTSDFAGAESFRDLPAWDGKPVKDSPLLVWTEQGVGDEILYGSMIPDVLSQTEDVLIACTKRMVPLFTRSIPEAQVMAQDDLKHDEALRSSVVAQCAAGSLGRFLRPSLESFPSRKAFLAADVTKVRDLATRYQRECGEGKRIGLSWRSANPRAGVAKSIGLTELAPIMRGANATFIDLQYGDTKVDRAALNSNHGLTVFRDDGIDAKGDIDAFAAQVAAMDLVITISNTTAHVAGALGVPCWVLLPSGPGLRWYWFLDRSDSPWYPSLRLFRQATPGDWTPVVQEVRDSLTGFLSA